LEAKSKGGSTLVNEKRIRVLVAKPGLDGHDRGAKVVARALRDAGMEVVYTGIRQTPEMIADVALQEDVDVVGLSILSGAHMGLFPLVLDELSKRGLAHVMVVAGGVIQDDDRPALRQMGIKEIFGPGTPTQSIVDFIKKALTEGAT
jgi:methylmalonyl-CoA mutase C-terminal domain/subunit